MYCDITLTKDEFKVIHNTLWELQYQGLNGEKGAERIREALKFLQTLHNMETLNAL